MTENERMRAAYRTVKNRSEIRLDINKSEFIAYAAQTETEEQAIAFVTEIRKRHPGANHCCFAYLAGVNDEFQKAEDDGEPAGTAGKPILEVIRKNNIKDVTVVVVRYFGGIKLGAGGLIRAYGRSAAEVMKAAAILERTLHSRICIELEYPMLGMVENQLHNRGYTITDKQFTDKVFLFVPAVVGKEAELRELVTEWTAGTALFSEAGNLYVDIGLNI